MVLDDFFEKRRKKKLEALSMRIKKERELANHRQMENALRRELELQKNRERSNRSSGFREFASTVGKGFKAAANYAGSLNVPDNYDVGLEAQKKKIHRARKKAQKGKPMGFPSASWIGDDYLKMGGKFS